MTEPRSIFRTLLDAMIESRTRQAERTLEYYRTTVDTYVDHMPKR